MKIIVKYNCDAATLALIDNSVWALMETIKEIRDVYKTDWHIRNNVVRVTLYL